MDALPETIVTLTNSLRRMRVFRRVNPSVAFGAKRKLSEGDYDRLFVQHLDVLTDVLRDAELIDASSKLKLLGQQISRIDVLLAEVDHSPEETFRRLVVVENKLYRNPEVVSRVWWKREVAHSSGW